MSIVYLGKRPANTYGNRAKRVRADPAPVISALVLAHLVSLLSSLFRVAFAILLLFGLVGSTVLCSFSYGEESRRHCCRQLRRQLYWSGHLDQW